MTCPKCGSDVGWKGPKYEYLGELLCGERVCESLEPTKDAPPPPPPPPPYWRDPNTAVRECGCRLRRRGTLERFEDWWFHRHVGRT